MVVNAPDKLCLIPKTSITFGFGLKPDSQMFLGGSCLGKG
jgi:hypothetical protein